MFSSQSQRNAIDHKQAVPVKSHVHVVTTGNALSSQMAKCAFSSIFILTKYLFHVCVTAQYEYYFLSHSVMCFFSFSRSLYSNKSRVFNFLTTSYLKVWLLWYFVLTAETLWQFIEMGEVKSGKTSQKCSDPFFLHLDWLCMGVWGCQNKLNFVLIINVTLIVVCYKTVTDTVSIVQL